MRNTTAVTLAFVVSALTAPLAARAQGPADLVGGWIVTSWTTADGTVNAQPQRGLFMFTQAGTYSIMYVNGTEPRPRYEGDTMTEAETLAAYASIVANSGRYTVEADTITYDAYVAKDPNYMDEWNMDTRANATRVTYSIKDGILTLKWLDGRTLGAMATLRRPNS